MRAEAKVLAVAEMRSCRSAGSSKSSGRSKAAGSNIAEIISATTVPFAITVLRSVLRDDGVPVTATEEHGVAG